MYQARLLDREDITDKRWNAFIDAHGDDLVYFYTWFLDGACDDWQAIIVEQSGELAAVMPLQLKKLCGFTYSLQPLFCKYLGVIFRTDLAENVHHSNQKKILRLIIDSLPRPLLCFNASFHSGFSNFLPFHWAQFSVTPRLTYRLSLTDKQNFSSSITNHLRKARINDLCCEAQTTPDSLIQLARKRDLFSEASLAQFRHLWQRLDSMPGSLLLAVKNKEGVVHSAAAFLMKGKRVYMIFSVVDETHKVQGANALLLTEAMKHFRNHGAEWFYFEGSMLENVETYISGFRPEPVLYFGMSKYLLPMTDRLLIPLYQKAQRMKEHMRVGIFGI
jgi:hypothetical protein